MYRSFIGSPRAVLFRGPRFLFGLQIGETQRSRAQIFVQATRSPSAAMEASDAIEGVIPGRDEGELPGGGAVMEHEAPELTKINSVGFYMNRFQELVGDVPNDYEAWTSLIAHVEKAHPNDIERICLIYDAFLSEYPLCYGYWNKYANHKARLCTLHEVEETYERAVLAVPYSVDMWVKYCSFGALTYEDPMDIRRLYERGLSFVKKDYFCHQLWDKYIEYEYSIQQWSQLAHLHIRTLVFPTKKLQSYYERFKKLVDIWSQKMGCQQDLELPRESMPLSRGMTDIKDNEYFEISNLIKEFMDQKGDHSKMAFRKYLSLGDQLYNRSRQIDEKICCFEACIRRRYFHLKPLDACQIDNWHQYLDFAEMQGDFDWTVKLYERCLIACASYSEFWIRYVEFVDAKGGREIANDALGRALTIFLKRVPAFHVYSGMYKEKIGDFSAACALVKQGLDLGSDFIGTVKKQANMEKRLGNMEVAYQTYEKAIKLAKENRNFDIIPSLYYNFAQFTFAASGSIDAARGVFIKGIQQTPCRAILEGLINFTTIHGSASEIPIIDVIIMNAVEPGSSVFQALSDQDREDISSLFVEFVDLYGDIHDIRKAWDRHRKLFPHIMDPPANHASTENSTMSKSRNASNGSGMDLICNGCIVNSNLAGDRQQTTILPAQSSYDVLEEVDAIGKLNLEINRNGTQEIQLIDAKIMEQSVEQSGPHNVANEQVHETHETNPQCSKFEDNSEPNFDDLRRLPSLDNLSLKSPDVNNLPVISTTLIDSELSEEVITVVSSSKVQDGEDAVEASEVHVTLDGKSSSSSQPDHNNESYSFQATGSPAIEAQLKFHQQLNPQSQSNLKHGLPNTIASPQIAGGGGSLMQINKRKQNPEDATSHDGHIQIQVSEHQNCQVQEEAQYPPGGNSSQLPPDQFHPYQSQVWSNTQAPQASQTQVLYQIAAAQAYQTANLAWTGQTMPHQGLVYVQSQPSPQSASQTQTYAYQQLNQNSEQYGYTQSGQVFNPQIWQYYQQQMYYLQQQQQQWQQQQQSQQQNQLTPNSSDLLSQVEQVQQQQEKKSQQMPTRSQQLVIQLQRKQNQKTNQQVHEHASSPEQKHNQPHQQQQQASQLQQQNEQANQTQHQQQASQLQQQNEQANQTQHQQQASQLQQQNGQANQTQHQQQASHLQQQNGQANQTQQQQQQLLYLQQQQQQIYMQQQQLYLQQLYQQQLFEQQQQQVPQQLQQYQLFQLQQQLFQLQQQQQPRIGTSEVQVQPAGYSQGGESKSQKVEQPERSHSSTPQRTPTH